MSSPNGHSLTGDLDRLPSFLLLILIAADHRIRLLRRRLQQLGEDVLDIGSECLGSDSDRKEGEGSEKVGTNDLVVLLDGDVDLVHDGEKARCVGSKEGRVDSGSCWKTNGENQREREEGRTGERRTDVGSTVESLGTELFEGGVDAALEEVKELREDSRVELWSWSESAFVLRRSAGRLTGSKSSSRALARRVIASKALPLTKLVPRSRSERS